MLEAIIWDMDGVIVDSEYTFLESKTEILHEAGFMKDISYQYQFMGTTNDFMWQTMKDELGLPKEVDFYINEMKRKREEMIARDGVRGIKGAADFIKELKKSGVKMAIASSSPKIEIERAVKELGIAHAFEALVSGEEVENSKPAPDVYLEAAKQLGVNPKNSLVFEDTKNGSIAANRAGMFVVGFENPDYPAQDLTAANYIVTNYDGINFEGLSKHF
ncbi:MAG: HAD-IA family hydrolase [Streptococcaceae bacterium]|jgi:HAD superfamily hydrolase (TIGR01509 family)|nr:HAD-IA family hydrolase [Streptococcaceae bacterium]